MYLTKAGEMQQMDRETINSFGVPGRVLMESAGRGAVAFFKKNFTHLHEKRVAVIAGRGNNGGDGFVMARYLAEEAARVVVYLLADSDRVEGDARANLDLLPKLDIEVVRVPDSESFFQKKEEMKEADIWIDAILGTGLKSDVRGFFKEVILFINHLKKPVFAVDIPSGLNSDTGLPCGTSILARATSTFGFAKPGHFVYPGPKYVGRLDIVDIGIPKFMADKTAPKQFLLTKQRVKGAFKPREDDAHKGACGHVLVLGGSPGKTGAGAMTAMTAMRTGAGLVTLGTPKSLNPVMETLVLEAMTAPLPETMEGTLGESALARVLELAQGKACLALGPGLGLSGETSLLVSELVRQCDIPMVIDADALTLLAEKPDVLKKAKAPLILTPHPGEMARLTGESVPQVQKDRMESARSFAEKYGLYLILKGAGTVIGLPDGRVFVNTTGNAGMAAGGMGDILTGVIGALLSQGFTPEDAALAGVYIHGAAADRLQSMASPLGYLASEVMNQIPGVIGELLD